MPARSPGSLPRFFSQSAGLDPGEPASASQADISAQPDLAGSGRGSLLRPLLTVSRNGALAVMEARWTDLCRPLGKSENRIRLQFKHAPLEHCACSVMATAAQGVVQWKLPAMFGNGSLSFELERYSQAISDCLLEAKRIARNTPKIRFPIQGLNLMAFLFLPAPGLPDRIKIVSGGQTGVDRGALDAALIAGLDCCGWCPKGRRAEDGRIPLRYPLMETDHWAYTDRTKRNILASDGTLIINAGGLSGGTLHTLKAIKTINRTSPFPIPHLTVQSDGLCCSPDQAAQWIRDNNISILNVAGPREGKAPGIQEKARAFLAEVFRMVEER